MAEVLQHVGKLVQILTPLAAVVTAAVGVVQWRAAKLAATEQARFESRRPFLTRQLELYGEAAGIAARLATSTDGAARTGYEERFWQLYWGELALVEDAQVEAAMVKLGEAIRANAAPEAMQPLSLALAHAIRQSLDRAWGVDAWSRKS